MDDFGRVARHIHRHSFGMFARRCFDTLEQGRPFHPNWHIDHLTHMLGEVGAGRVRRLNINVPPLPQVDPGLRRPARLAARA